MFSYCNHNNHLQKKKLKDRENVNQQSVYNVTVLNIPMREPTRMTPGIYFCFDKPPLFLLFFVGLHWKRFKDKEF